jgi:hypothetical protein
MLELLPFLRSHSASSADESSFALLEAIASQKVKRELSLQYRYLGEKYGQK